MNRWALMTCAALAGACASVDSTATVYRCEAPDGSTYYGNWTLPGARCREIPVDAPRTATVPASPATQPRGVDSPGTPGATAVPAIPAVPAAPPVGARAVPSPWPEPPPVAVTFDFIDQERNLLEFRQGAAFAAFSRKWSDPARKVIVIAHFGDSHLQNGIAPDALRRRLQAVRGDAGRGMLFPFAIAKTYSHNDYSSTYEGRWESANSIQQPPKLPVGVSGFIARTADPKAAFTIQFRQSPQPGPRRVRVLVRTASPGWQLTATSGPHRFTQTLGAFPAGGEPFVEFVFPELAGALRFELGQTGEGAGSAFELHGISIENDAPGVLHHNLGVGGANFGALLAQRHFAEQFRALAPDLVVLDWGTNDIVYRNQVPERHAEVVEATIRAIREVSPQTAIVLTSVQDMNYRGRNISAAAEYAAVMRALAFSNDCAFYDWYRISGGADAMRLWFANGLAQKDNIHLTARGYQLKGDLFARALIGTLERLARGGDAPGLEPSTQSAAWRADQLPQAPARGAMRPTRPATEGPPSVRVKVAQRSPRAAGTRKALATKPVPAPRASKRSGRSTL